MASQSLEMPHQTAPRLDQLAMPFRNDQSFAATGRHGRRRKFPRLFAMTNRARHIPLVTNPWYNGRVLSSTHFPSLTDCPAVEGWGFFLRPYGPTGS